MSEQRLLERNRAEHGPADIKTSSPAVSVRLRDQ